MSDNIRIDISTHEAESNIERLTGKLTQAAHSSSVLIKTLENLNNMSGRVDIDVYASLKTKPGELKSSLRSLINAVNDSSSGNKMLIDVGVSSSSISNIKKTLSSSFENFRINVGVDLNFSNQSKAAILAEARKMQMQMQINGLPDVEAEYGKKIREAKKNAQSSSSKVKVEIDADTSSLSEAIKSFDGRKIKAVLDVDPIINTSSICKQLSSVECNIDVNPIVNISDIQRQFDAASFSIKTSLDEKNNSNNDYGGYRSRRIKEDKQNITSSKRFLSDSDYYSELNKVSRQESMGRILFSDNNFSESNIKYTQDDLLQSKRLQAALNTLHGRSNVGELSSYAMQDDASKMMSYNVKKQLEQMIFNYEKLFKDISDSKKGFGKISVLRQDDMGSSSDGIRRGRGGMAISQDMIEKSFNLDGGETISKNLSSIISKSILKEITNNNMYGMKDDIEKEFNSSGAFKRYKNINQWIIESIANGIHSGDFNNESIKKMFIDHIDSKLENNKSSEIKKRLEYGVGAIDIGSSSFGKDQNKKMIDHEREVKNSIKQSKIQQENRDWLDVRDFERKTERVTEGLKRQGNAFEFFMDNARQGFIEWGLSMSGIAASIFVFQQVSQIVMELAKNFDDAVMGSAKLSQSISISAKDYVASKEFISLTRKNDGLKSDETVSAIASAIRQGSSYDQATKYAPSIAKVTKQGLTKDSDQAASVIINNAMGARDAYLEFLSITDNTYTDKFEKLGGALDNLKSSFEGAFGDDIKSYLENITGWINDNNQTIVGFVKVLSEAIKLVGFLGVGYGVYKGVSSLNKTGAIQQRTNQIFNQSASQGVGISRFDAHSRAIAEQQGQPSPRFGIGNVATGLLSAGKSFGIGAAVTAASFAAEKLIGVMYDVYKLSDEIEKSQGKFAEKLGLSAEQYKKMSVSQNDLNNGVIVFSERFNEMNFSEKKQMYDDIPRRKSELKKQLETIAWKQTLDISNIGGYNDEENTNYKGEMLSRMGIFERISQASTTGRGGDQVKAIKEEFEKLKSMQEHYKKWFEKNGINVGPNSARIYDDIVATHKAMYDELGIASEMYNENLDSETRKKYNTIIELAEKHGDKMKYIISKNGLDMLGLEKASGKEITLFIANELKKRAEIKKNAEREALLYSTLGVNREEHISASAASSVQDMDAVLRSLNVKSKDMDVINPIMTSLFSNIKSKELGTDANKKIEEMLSGMAGSVSEEIANNRTLFLDVIKKSLSDKFGGDDKYVDTLSETILDSFLPGNIKKTLEEKIKASRDSASKTGIVDPNIGNMVSDQLLEARNSIEKQYSSQKNDSVVGLPADKKDLMDSVSSIMEKVYKNKDSNAALFKAYEEDKLLADKLKEASDVLKNAGESQKHLPSIKEGMYLENMSKLLTGGFKDLKNAELATESEFSSYKDRKATEHYEFIRNERRLKGGLGKEYRTMQVEEYGKELNMKGVTGSDKKEMLALKESILGSSEKKEAANEMISLLEQKGRTGDEDAAIKAAVEKVKLGLSESNFGEELIKELEPAIRDIHTVNSTDRKIKEFSDTMTERYKKTGVGISDALKGLVYQKINEYSKAFDVNLGDDTLKVAALSITKRNLLKEVKDSKIDILVEALVTNTDMDDISIFSEKQKEEMMLAFSLSEKQIDSMIGSIKKSAIDKTISDMEDNILNNKDASTTSKSKISTLKKLFERQISYALEDGFLNTEESEKVRKILNIDKFSGLNSIGNEKRVKNLELLIAPAKEYYNVVGAMSKEMHEQELDFIEKRAQEYKILGADAKMVEKISSTERRNADLSRIMFDDKKLYNGVGADSLKDAGIGSSNATAIAKGFTSFYDDSIDQMKKWSEYGKSVAKDFEDSMVGAFKGTSGSFSDMIKRIGDDFMETMIRMQMNNFMTQTINPLIQTGVSSLFSSSGLASASSTSSVPSGWFSGIGSAKGDAFVSSEKINMFADGGVFTNKVYSNPTPFRFASGGSFNLGVMAEAGPEAVMPLARDSSGSLGIKTVGNNSASDMNIEINITNEGNEKLQASKAEANFDESGKMIINVVMQGIQNNQGGIRKMIQTVSRQ